MRINGTDAVLLVPSHSVFIACSADKTPGCITEQVPFEEVASDIVRTCCTPSDADVSTIVLKFGERWSFWCGSVEQRHDGRDTDPACQRIGPRGDCGGDCDGDCISAAFGHSNKQERILPLPLWHVPHERIAWAEEWTYSCTIAANVQCQLVANCSAMNARCGGYLASVETFDGGRASFVAEHIDSCNVVAEPT